MNRALRIATSTLLFTVCAACSRTPNEPIEVRQPVSQTRITSAALDNIDKSGASVLPVDPENATTPADRDLIEQLRSAVVADDTISTTSKELVLAAHGGVITLSGLVKNVREHDAILEKARILAGRSRVVDEIEVESP